MSVLNVGHFWLNTDLPVFYTDILYYIIFLNASVDLQCYAE